MGVADEVFVVRGILASGDGVIVELKAPMDHEDRKAAAERVMADRAWRDLGLADDVLMFETLKGSVGMGGLDSRPSAKSWRLSGATTDTAKCGGGRDRSYGSEVSYRRDLQVMHENDQLHSTSTRREPRDDPEELHEALFQAPCMVGSPGWNNASNVARHVFRQRGFATLWSSSTAT